MRAVDGRYQRQSNTTLTSLDLHENGLEEGGGQALAEAPRINTKLTSLHLGYNGLGEGGGRALAETLRIDTTSTPSTFARIT